MRYAFGLDLAGYSTGKSELAVAWLLEQRLNIVLLKNNPLARVVTSSVPWDSAASDDANCVLSLLALGSLAIDVPIDLQGLPDRPTSPLVWGLTKRPVDQAFGALPPLADRIGSPVSRFRAFCTKGALDRHLGVTLFETYPAASLANTGHSGKGYKGDKGADGRTALSRHLFLDADVFTDDELDAIICALVALGPSVLDGVELENAVEAKVGLRSIPRGYRLLSKLPTTVTRVVREDYGPWITAHRA